MPHKSHFLKHIYNFEKNSEKQQNLLEKIGGINIALHCIHTTFLVGRGFMNADSVNKMSLYFCFW